jgi:hypothetical protein
MLPLADCIIEHSERKVRSDFHDLMRNYAGENISERPVKEKEL